MSGPAAAPKLCFHGAHLIAGSRCGARAVPKEAAREGSMPWRARLVALKKLACKLPRGFTAGRLNSNSSSSRKHDSSTLPSNPGAARWEPELCIGRRCALRLAVRRCIVQVNAVPAGLSTGALRRSGAGAFKPRQLASCFLQAPPKTLAIQLACMWAKHPAHNTQPTHQHLGQHLAPSGATARASTAQPPARSSLQGAV